jgi:hypothetical protein
VWLLGKVSGCAVEGDSCTEMGANVVDSVVTVGRSNLLNLGVSGMQ